MVLSLAACGGGGNDKPNSTGNNSTGNDTQTNDANKTDDTNKDDTQPAGEKRQNRLIYSTGTKMQGELGCPAEFDNNATDYTIAYLMGNLGSNGYATYVPDQFGEYVANPTVLDGDVDVVDNGDQTRTATFKIKQGLMWNNGEPITAVDYCANVLISASKQFVDAGSWNTPDSIVGAMEYQAGTADTITGVHLIDDYTFSVSITPDYYSYYYQESVLGFSPRYYKGFNKDLVVKDDGNGIYFEGTFTVDDVNRVRYNYDSPVTEGPYILKSLDLSAYSAVLEINPNYAGNFEGQKPSIQQLIVKYQDSATQFDALKTGAIDFIDSLGDGTEIEKGLDLVDAGGYACDTFDRAGYGYLGFICDGGPTQFVEVRQAIAYLLDRNEFCSQFTKGHGIVVNGPYGTAQAQYQRNKEWFASNLNAYEYNPETAKATLDAGGWNLNADGTAYSGSGTRYKEVTAEQAVNYEELCVTLADGRILMPLKIRWITSENNAVSDLLATMLGNGPQVADAGIEIVSDVVSFPEMQNWVNRSSDVDPKYGKYYYGMFNMATGWTSSAYDQSWYYSTDHTYDQYNRNKIYDDVLSQTSRAMVYEVTPGDEAAYDEAYLKFMARWNEMMPDIPLYSNTYHTFYPEWLKDYDADSFWDFGKAIIYAYIEGAE